MFRDRQRNGEHGAGAVAAVRRRDGAVHGLHEAARDRKSETSAGAHLVTLLGAVELVEDMLQVTGRDAVALVEDLQADRSPVTPALDSDRGAGTGIFRGIVQDVEQYLLEQHGVEVEQRQVRLDCKLDVMMTQNLCCAPQGAANDFAEVM